MEEKVVAMEKYRDDVTPEKLFGLDTQAAENIFNKLPLARKVDIVLAAPWEMRMNLILLAENARELVQALPEEEIFWTIKQRGPGDSLALVSLTTHDQFQYLVDIDCWSKDSLDSKSIGLWYKLLSKCHESKVMEWFSKADEELLVCSLKKLVKVIKIQEETDRLEENDHLPPSTIDDVYYFSFPDDDDRLTIMPILHSLYQNYRSRFYSLVEGAIWDSDFEAEEDAFFWRQKRTAEQGFPDFDEAMSIYQFISEKEIKLLMKSCKIKDAVTTDKTAHCIIKLRYVFNREGMPVFLQNVLRTMSSQQALDTFQRYTVTLANKMIIADALVVNDVEDMKKSLRKVMGYMNIGLELLSEGEINKAQSFLEHIHPAVLFRIGYSRIIKSKTRGEKRKGYTGLKDKEMALYFFDPPWAEALSGLMRKRPMLFEGVIKKGSLAYRDFESLDEVSAVERIVDLVEVAEQLLFDFFKLEQGPLFSDFFKGTALNDASELKCMSIFLTVLANHILYGRTKLVPLTADELMAFLKKVFEKDQVEERYVLNKNLYDDCVSWINTQYVVDERSKSGLSGFVSSCLGMLEEEFSSLVSKKIIDNRYVAGILLKKGSAS
ncbi:MAG: DUF6178 family protein [Pseudomonadota bacterium]